MNSKTSHSIKSKVIPNDVFITPRKLAKLAIEMIDVEEGVVWLDPFKNNGSYYDQFPDNVYKKWCEILYGKDFFEFNEDLGYGAVICSNPPYSILDKVIKHSIFLRPKVIQYLLGINNMTARRLEMMETAGYGLVKIHMCKVFQWYGMSCIFQFEFGKDSIISYDRKVWKEEKND